MKFYSTLLLALIIQIGYAQEQLSSKHLEGAAIRFKLTDQNQIQGDARTALLDLIGSNQFVGLAEVHNTQQLGYFTTGLLDLLAEKEFSHFALEIGPHSASILQEISENPKETFNNIKLLNKTYGRKGFSNIPVVFVDKIEDALFVEKASRLNFTFWGLDQEYVHSDEMHIDNLFELAPNKTPALEKSYLEVKELVSKNLFKNKVSGQGKNCWLLQEQSVRSFFALLEGIEKAQQIINDLRKSWDIYCRYESNKPSNQVRANYMKQNFDSLYTIATRQEKLPKVFVKLGGVHLTHGKSPFRVDDMGMHLHNLAEKNQTGFLSIRHLVAYKNGKSNIGKSGWKGVGMFLELGKIDQWTLVDLRPFKEKVLNGELSTNDKFLHELKSYDLLLLPPDDKTAKINY